jgi:MFS family permease
VLTRLRSADSVLQNRPFLYLWSAQAVSQTAQNSVFYGLMISVERATGSTLHMSFLILTTVIPTVLFGALAGVYVDRWSKRTVMVTTNLLRVVVCSGFALLANNPPFLYLFNVLFSIVAQFFAPAEVALIPALVPRSKLMAANGVFNMTCSTS